MKHPHDEVIRAWLDGKKIQTKYENGQWFDVTCNPTAGGSPHFRGSEPYRIKPEKKKVWVNIYLKGLASYHDDKTLADIEAPDWGWRLACIEVEFEEGQGL